MDIWNITQQLQAVDDPALLERYNLDTVTNPVKPLYSFNGHQQEGFGIDWCPTEPGVGIEIIDCYIIILNYIKNKYIAKYSHFNNTFYFRY